MNKIHRRPVINYKTNITFWLWYIAQCVPYMFKMITMIDLKSHWNSYFSIFPIESVWVQNRSHGRWRHCYAEPKASTLYLLTFLFNWKLLYHRKWYMYNVYTILIMKYVYTKHKTCVIHKAKWSIKLTFTIYPMSIWNGTCLVVVFMRRNGESESTNEWSKSLLSAVKWHFYREGLWNDLNLDLFMKQLLTFETLKLKRIN